MGYVLKAVKRAVTTDLRNILEESFQQGIDAFFRKMGKFIDTKGNHVVVWNF